MTAELLRLVLSFLLVTVIGAWLTHRWQLRTWLAQQKVADRDQRYGELKTLYDDLDKLGNRRIFRTRRLAWSLLTGKPNLVEDRLKVYDEAVVEWNERYNGIYIRFVRNLEEGTYLFDQLGAQVNLPLVNAGRHLGDALRELRETGSLSDAKTKEVRSVLYTLETVNSHFIWVLRDIYKALQATRSAKFSVLGLDNYTSLQELESANVSHVGLLKFIFKSREQA